MFSIFIWIFLFILHHLANGQLHRTHFPASPLTQTRVIQCPLFLECGPIAHCANQEELKSNPKKMHFCGWRHGLPMVCCKLNKSSQFENKLFQKEDLDKQKLPKIREKESLKSKMTKNFEICGTRIKQISMYIVGGSNVVSVTKYPWFAFIALLKDESYLTYNQNDNSTSNLHHYCGATIITDQFLISSAHCFPISSDDLDLSNYRIGVGNIELPKMQIHEIEQVFIHPNASMDNHYNDVALIKLKDKLKFNSRIRPACLPFLEFDFNDEESSRDEKDDYRDKKLQDESDSNKFRPAELQKYGFANPNYRPSFYGFVNPNYQPDPTNMNEANFNLRTIRRQFPHRYASRYHNDYYQFRTKRSNAIKFEKDYLYNELFTRPSSKVIIAGLGDTSFGGTRPSVLKEADLMIVDKNKCNDLYMRLRSPSLKFGLNQEFLCAPDRRLASKLNTKDGIVDPRTSPRSARSKRSLSYWIDYFSNRIRQNRETRLKKKGLIRSGDDKDEEKNDKKEKESRSSNNKPSLASASSERRDVNSNDKKKKDEDYKDDLVNILTEEELREKLISSNFQDACQGDSGGAMVQHLDSSLLNKTLAEYKDNRLLSDKFKKNLDAMSYVYERIERKGLEGRFMLVGLVSLGRNCGDKEYPGVYVNTNYHKDWILDTLSGVNTNDQKYKM